MSELCYISDLLSLPACHYGIELFEIYLVYRIKFNLIATSEKVE